MSELMRIGEADIEIKEFNGQRVVTFKDIDAVHGRPEGTARKRFADNRQHFIEGEDYFVLTSKTLENAEKSEKRTFEKLLTSPRGIALITEQGYLMLVKSFTDDLAWKVQRQLVNSYFRVRREVTDLSPNMVVLYKMLDQMADTERKANEAKAIAEKANQSVENIKDAVAPVFDNWRSEMTKKFNRIQMRCGEEFKDLRTAMYMELDRRAHVDTKRRLNNMKERMLCEGTSKSAVDRLNRMDVIEQDAKLREIFSKIVSEYEIRYCA